jgi:hypothetical protein
MQIQGMSFSTIQRIIEFLPKPHYMDGTIHGSFNIYSLVDGDNSAVKSEQASSKREINQGSIWYRDEEITKQEVLTEFQRLVEDQELGTLAVYWRNIDGCADIGLTPYCITIYRNAQRSQTVMQLISMLENSDAKISITPLPLITKPLEE